MAAVVYLVVPCYNEEEVLPEASKRLIAKLEGLRKKSLPAKKAGFCLWMTAARTKPGS